MRNFLLSALLVIVGLPVVHALAQVGYKPGPDNVVLPTGYQANFVRYTTVDKPDRKIIRYLYANLEAFAAAKKGEPLPNGTVLIMEDHAVRLSADGSPLLDQQGRFIPQAAVSNLFVQEKRAGWGVGYPDTTRNGEWEYARFNADGSRNTGPVEACFTCHKNLRAGQDYVFNFWDYLQTRK